MKIYENKIKMTLIRLILVISGIWLISYSVFCFSFNFILKQPIFVPLFLILAGVLIYEINMSKRFFIASFGIISFQSILWIQAYLFLYFTLSIGFYIQLVTITFITILLLVSFVRKYLNFSKGGSESLKSLIGEKRLFYETIQIKIFQIYWPSWPSIIVLIIFSIFLLTPSHMNLDILVPGLAFRDSNHYQNLIAILAGISAIIFALIVFIAQQFNRDHNEASLLLKRSYLYPLLVLTIFSFFNFLWCDISVLSLIPIFFIGIFVIFSVSRLLSILLSRYKFFKENMKFINDKFKRSIELAIKERMGNNLLLKKLEKMKIRYHFTSIQNKKNYYNFYSYKRGIIQDINLLKLKDFSDIVENEANKNGYSFDKNERKPSLESANTGESPSVKKEEFYIENKFRYLLKKYKDPVNEDTILICIDKKLINDKDVIIKLQNQIEEIFTIKAGDSDFSSEIKLELRDIKDQFINAIKSENLGKIEDIYEIYPEFEESFIKLLKKYGGYNFKQAQDEIGAFFGGWNEIRWLSDDIRDIFDIGMDSHNRKIIKKIEYLPILMAHKALELDDHLFFQKFIDFVIRLYWASQKEPDNKLKSDMVKFSCQHLKDTSSIIEFKLEDSDLTKEELLSLKDFEVYLLIVLQYLLEESKKYNDLESFKSFNNVASKLFAHFSNYLEYSKSTIELESELKNNKLNENEKMEIRKQIENKKTLEEIEEEINIRRSQMFFGLATWIFGNFKQKKNEYKGFYSEIEKSLPTDFKKFTAVFLSSHTFEADSFWNWMRWEKFPDDRAIIVDTMGKLERYYVIRSLKLLNEASEKKIKKIDLTFDNEDYNKDLYFLGRNEAIDKFLDEITENHEKWKFILNTDEINCIDTFKEILKSSKQIWGKIEKEKMRKGNVSGKKVEEFKNEILDGFNEYKSLRNIFKYLDIYEDRINEIKSGMSRFGMNRIDDKAIFFDKWHVEYPNWGYEYGKGISTGENSYLLKKIVDCCKEIPKTDFEDKINTFDNISELIILFSGFESNMFFINSNKFKKKGYYKAHKSDLGNADDLNFIGYYNTEKGNIPVFGIFGTDINKVIIVKKDKLGKLTQYSPLKEGEDPSLIKDIFYMDIKAFSNNLDLIEKFLGESIDWLEQIGTKEEQREYLKEKVWIQILEKYEYKPDDEFKGYYIEFSNKND